MNNAYTFIYQTNKLKNDHIKLVLTVYLYTNGHLEPVYHQPLTRADMSKLNLFDIQVFSSELFLR